METFLLLIESWWWVTPVAAGAGVAAYGGLTTRRRRARRLELDAEREQESRSYRALVEARAQVRHAQAASYAARAVPGATLIESMVPSTPEAIAAWRRVLDAKRAEKAAAFALRASRSRIKALQTQYRAASRTDPLPIERVFQTHDAVIARWMAYETDPAKALDYPQMLDPRHPATVAFFEAHREAARLRPASAREKVTPQRFLDYRAAVAATVAAFDEAERQSGAHTPPARRP
ncbi:hypothetical protein AB1K54_16665 [Microbacterium sp. BWT-B31]|uniref:hypothetical protein n=1 Tax=Microbacterium sp. BWT-B31 TaxID=3232072 RepID=UPI00352959D8